MKCGISYKEFFHMTMREVVLTIESYAEKLKDENEKAVYLAWLTGAYVRQAVASVLSKDARYPDSPLDNKVEEKELTEEEQIEYVKLLFAQFDVEKQNFDANKQKNEVGA